MVLLLSAGEDPTWGELLTDQINLIPGDPESDQFSLFLVLLLTHSETPQTCREFMFQTQEQLLLCRLNQNQNLNLDRVRPYEHIKDENSLKISCFNVIIQLK